ncbi:hypothetical protein JL11_06200 [Brevundimonas sp. DS20]|nr:hypothetical protein JL11_06200 [Brevundimonas sp. DS20]
MEGEPASQPLVLLGSVGSPTHFVLFAVFFGPALSLHAAADRIDRQGGARHHAGAPRQRLRIRLFLGIVLGQHGGGALNRPLQLLEQRRQPVAARLALFAFSRHAQTLAHQRPQAGSSRLERRKSLE